MHPNRTPNRICEFCARPFFAFPSSVKRGGGRFCDRACYMRAREAGIATTGVKKLPPLIERFWSHVNSDAGPDACWMWEGPHGLYGQLQHKRKSMLAHRLSWQIANGDIPEGMHVCHKCDTPLCVNPAHLFLGTNLDNIADKVAKGRQRRGEQMPNALLTDDLVREIRARYQRGVVTCPMLAREYGVSKACIEDVVRRKSWKHV